MVVKKCIRQVFRPKGYHPSSTPAGCGDCRICTTDDQNVNCSMYFPIGLTAIENLTPVFKSMTDET